MLVASTDLTRLLVLDTRLVVAPVEPAEAVLCLIPEDVPFETLILQALQNRPELAQSKELVQAAIVRLKQARLRPFIPSVAATYAGGGLGVVKRPSLATSAPVATSWPVSSGNCNTSVLPTLPS